MLFQRIENSALTPIKTRLGEALTIYKMAIGLSDERPQCLKILSLFVITFIFCLSVYGQKDSKKDSLQSIYKSGNYPKEGQLKILKELAMDHSNSDTWLFYSETLIKVASELDSPDYVFQGYLQKGNALRVKGDLSNALESYFIGAQIAEEQNLTKRLGTVYIAIADVYDIMGNHKNATKYQQNAIRILRQEKDSVNIASALLNAGDAFTNAGKLDTAMIYTKEAETIFQKIHSPMGQAYSLGNLGTIYAKQSMDLKAEYSMNKAILLLEALKEYPPIPVYLNYIADIYLEKGDANSALKFANQSLKLSQQYGMKKEIGEAYLKLSKILERTGNIKESYTAYKRHISYQDSVNNISSVQQMAELRTDFEISKKQIEVDLLNMQKRNQQIIVLATAIALILIALLAFGLYRRYRYVNHTNQIIAEERDRSDSLLLNILPKETAQELKERGKVAARKFESVTVLFTDFEGFTRYAESLAPEQLVESIDYYFSKFDQIIEAHGLEKIKTIGDAYMCAGGLPFPSKDHALKVVKAALEIAAFVKHTKQSTDIVYTFDVRIGINSGPVVAGVVGTKKFAYDIWGDTVNLAARMETGSEPNKINVSQHTYELIKDEFICQYRGGLEAKNKGMVKMYFVDGASPN